MFKEFTVRDIFPPVNIQKYAKKPETLGNIPFVSCQTTNNGISTYCGETPEVNHCITVSTNGNCFDCFWHNYPIIPSSDVEVLHKDGITDDEKISLYLCALLAPNTKLYSYSNKPKNGKVFDTKLILPVIENSNPDHEYTVEDIDWQYMREKIKELEREKIKELDAYLKATGLNDYDLNDEDKAVLCISDEKYIKDFVGDVIWKKVKIGDMFEKCDLKRIKKTFNKSEDVSKEKTEEYSIPLVNAKHGNNGIMYYGRKSDWETTTFAIDIVNDGAISTGDVYPQPQETGVLYNAYLIKCKEEITDEKILLFLAPVIEKVIKDKFGYDNKASWEKVKEEEIELPFDSNGNLHKLYIYIYIRAIEKTVIKEMILWKDRQLEILRKIV